MIHQLKLGERHSLLPSDLLINQLIDEDLNEADRVLKPIEVAKEENLKRWDTPPFIIRSRQIPPLKYEGIRYSFHPFTGWPLISAWMCKTCVAINQSVRERCKRCGRKG